MKQTKATVVSNIEILPGGPHRAGWALSGHLMRLRCPKIASEAKPGQFIMVRCGDENFLPRPFSVHESAKGTIVLFFAVLEGGKGSQWLSKQQVNETIEVFGPLGNGFSILPSTNNILLIAGGMGLAPLCFLAQQAVREKRSVTLLLGSAIGPLYSERPGNLLPPEINIATATNDGSKGHHGMVTDLIPKYIDWADQVFACGPVAMYKTMAQMSELKGKSVQISLEIMMGCGMGVCYGCTIRTKKGLKQVCKDGPVFEMGEVEK